METRPSYLVVGIFVLILSAGAALAGLWFAKTDIDRRFETYEVVFTGSVGGLQQGSQVLYRGVPVGRVADLRIDPDNIGRILATIEVEAGTPVKTDTAAELSLQGVTGLANIELLGGSHESPDLIEVAETEPPRIVADPSALEQVFESGPELLARGVVLIERLSDILSEDNRTKISGAIDDMARVSRTLAERDEALGRFIDDTAAAGGELRAMAEDFSALVTELDGVTTGLETRVDNLAEAGTSTLGEFERAGVAFRNLAWRADRMLETIEEPVEDFGQAGLYDFTEMVREMRLLIAAANRITKELERDPAGFLIGGSQRGFTPE